MDDLLQEAYIVFMKCKKAYPNIDSAPWFMAVYSRSLHNKFINLTKQVRPNTPMEFVSEEELGITPDNNYLMQVLRELPEEVKALVKKMMEGGKGEQSAYLKLKALFAEAPVPHIKLRPIKTV